MSDNKVEISLLISNKPGILASIMMQGDSLGLMYYKHQLEKLDNTQSRMTIIFEGNLNCSENKLINAIESHSEVYSIEKISIGDLVTAPISSETTTNLDFVTLRAHYVITPESLQVAEEKLSKILGYGALKLVKAAAAKTKHIGDLYLLLAEELEGEDRDNFLALVSNLNLDHLK